MENTSTARTQAVSGRTWKWVNKTIIYVIVTFLAAVIRAVLLDGVDRFAGGRGYLRLAAAMDSRSAAMA